MHRPQGYAHSPHINKPQSYFSRILLPEECSRADRITSTLKRPLVEGCFTSPRESKRQTSRIHEISSSLKQTNISRLPTFLDFQPDPGYYSAAFKRRLQPVGSLRTRGKAFQVPKEPVTDSKETFERALRILDSKKRAPLHLETDSSPSSDGPTQRISDGQDSKRRRLLDVASVGSTKENEGFQFTSLDELKKNPTGSHSRHVNHAGDKNGIHTPPRLPSLHVVDVKNSLNTSTVDTPVRDNSPPSNRTPRSASAVRRLIPYLSPAELDALFFGNKDTNDEYSTNEVSDGEVEFCVLSNSKAIQSFTQESPIVKQEDTSKFPDVCTVPRQSASLLGRARDSRSVPRVGSVARFVANLESRSRKPSPLVGSTSANRSNSVSSGSFQSCLAYRSPSDISSRVSRIRQLLSAQTEHATTLKSSSPTQSNSLIFPPTVSTNGTPITVSSGNVSHVTTAVCTATTVPTVSSSAAFDLPSFSTATPSSGALGTSTASSSAVTTSTPAPTITFSANVIPSSTPANISNSSLLVPKTTVSTAVRGFPSFSLPTTSGSSSLPGFPPASVPSTASIASTTSSFTTAAIITNPTPNTPVTHVSSTLPTSVVANPVGLSTPFGTQLTPAISGNASVATTSAQSNPAQSQSLFNFKTPSLTTSTSSVSVSTTPSLTATLFNFGSSNLSQPVTTSVPVPSTTTTGLTLTSAPFTFAKPPISSNVASVTTTPSPFTFNASKPISASTSSTTVVPSTQPLFSFSSSPSTNTTVGNTSTVSLSGVPGSTPTPPLFNFGEASRTKTSTASMASTVTVTSVITTANPVQTSTFSGFAFGSALGSKSVQSGGLFATDNITTTGASTNQTSNLFTMGMKPSSFATGSSQPTQVLGSFERTQSNTASPFASLTKPIVTTTKAETNNCSSPVLFGAPTTSSQLTSSTTAPGQLFSFGSCTSTSIPNNTSFSTLSTSPSLFAFGQKPTSAAPILTTTSSGFGFQGFGNSAMTSAVTPITTSNTVGSIPFQFGASPSAANATKFNFSSPSLGSTSSTAVPTFGNTTGFNFGQTSCFANSNSSVTNPFAFGTTPPTAAGTTGAVALPRRRPASARRTRRV
ncbi:hypothetical protein FGIG_10111 [Fasciola gigantica]|uniref:Uncharacterized protein n=1 Tax=Fasciola gigantica TaxID=46835 RepID=A0A504YT83_FASGI|nr:hypothetical protein FGIG_10111 [Fasciola gigantica]